LDGVRTLRVKRRKDFSVERHENFCRIWPLAVWLTLLTALLFVIPGFGEFAPDNRVSQFWNPSKFFFRPSQVWSFSDLGKITPSRGWILRAYSSVLEIAGASPWLIQRIFHVTLIVGGSLGAAMVAREFLGRSRIGPAVAGTYWITSAYTVVFLMPSDLYVNVVVAPWLFLAWIRGTTTPSRWRWAAVFASAVAVAGFINPPGLILASLPLIPLAGYQIWTRQSSWAVTVRWLARALLLTVAISISDIYRARLFGNAYTANLLSTETADAVSRSASWSESLRGLGQWLIYWNPSGSMLQPWLKLLVSNPLVILMSFIPIIVAFAVVAWTSWRPRFLFGGIVLMSAALMVGLHPLERSSPLGELIQGGYDRSPFLFSFRNTYKAGAGLLLATSVLVGFAASWLTRKPAEDLSRKGGTGETQSIVSRKRLRKITKVGGAVILAGTMIATSSPVWTGQLYSRSNPLSEIPNYWRDALKWLDQRDSPGSALVLPGGMASVYRWGNATNGDLFETFLESQYIFDVPLAQPSSLTANLISEVSRRISTGKYLPGSLTQIAGRLGISHIVLRNDTEWERNSSVRPAYFDQLRSSPELLLVATFGQPGENVTGVGDDAVEALRELEIPPVEIFAVRGFGGTVRAVSGPSVLLSGDGAAWPLLSASGKLDAGNPVRYSADLTLGQIHQELESGASVVMTDTNRSSADLFGRPGSRSVVVSQNATAFVDLKPNPLLDAIVEANPRRAFDGWVKSRFLTGAYRKLSTDAGLRVELSRPATLDAMTFSTVVEPGLRQVKRFEIVTSTGVNIPVEVADGVARVEFAEQQGVTWFEIRVTEITGEGVGAWGFNEIEVDGLDLSSTTQVPDDIIRATEIDSRTFDLLTGSDISYQFERISALVRNYEDSMRRRFRVATKREYIGSGTLLVANQTDIELANLIGLTTFGASTSRFGESLQASALFAFDGSNETAWSFDSSRTADLNVFFESQVVTTVRLLIDISSLDAKKMTIELNLDGQRISDTVDVPADCTRQRICTVNLDLGSERSMAKTLAISIRTFSEGGDAGSGKINVAEVTLNGQSNIAFPVLNPERCHDVGALIDGKSQDVRFVAPANALFTKQPITFSFCKPTMLLPGWRNFISSTDLPFSTLKFDLVDKVEPTAVVDATAVVQNRSSSRIDILVNGPKGTILVSGMAPSRIWKATADGKNLGAPITVDGQMAWVLPNAGSTLVQIEAPAQRTADWLFVLSAITFAIALLLVFFNPRRRSDIHLETRLAPVGSQSVPRTGLAFVQRIVNANSFCVVVSGLLAGVAGVVVSACVVFLVSRGLLRIRIVGSVAVGLITLAAIATVPPLGPAINVVTPEWPNIRTLAWVSARLGAVVLLTCITQGIVSDGIRGTATSSSDEAELPDKA
jgi:arabinofuranan 3-O-arabinosyltransferase